MIGKTHFFDIRSTPHDPDELTVRVDLDALPSLLDHGFQEMVVLSGSTYIEAVLAAIERAGEPLPKRLENIDFKRVFLLPGRKSDSFKLCIRRTNTASSQYDVYASSNTRNDASNTRPHATIRINRQPASGSLPKPLALDAMRNSLTNGIESDAFYQSLNNNGNQYGPGYQAITQYSYSSNEALAAVKLPEQAKDVSGFHLHPVILDACIQAVIASQLASGQTFVLTGIEGIDLLNTVPSEGWIHAHIKEADRQSYFGDVILYDENLNPAVRLQGVRIQPFDESEAHTTDLPVHNIALAATFTAEPIEPTFSFWAGQWNRRAEVTFAPYNQPFQELLDPTSTFSANRDGVNILVLRLEDWMKGNTGMRIRTDETRKTQLLRDRLTYRLPNKAEIAHLNPYETEYLYKEIFADRAYLRHGISLDENACVIDVGANIGMFTLFALQEAPGATIYSFEPSPAVFDALNANAALYGENVRTFNCGLSDRDGEASFTFYKHSSVFSSYHADAAADRTAIRTVVENVLEQQQLADSETLEVLTQDFMEDRMESETFACPIRSLSSIIDEEGIERIDLLKVDVEKSELEVLRGIEERHWPIIRQVVLEVHDTEGAVIDEVTSILRSQGFELAIEEEELLQESGLYNIYASRSSESEVESDSHREEETQLERNLSDFIQAVSAFMKRSKVPLLVSVCRPSPDIAASGNYTRFFERIESRLEEELAAFSNVHLIRDEDAEKNYPVEHYYDPEGDALGHVPYTSAYFTALGTSLFRQIQAIERKPYKVIVLDCDNTLWTGVCGEDGVDGVRIDAARKRLQSFVREQMDAGMLLCLCSKNVEEDVRAVFDFHTDMPLKWSDLVATKINWRPKSENLIALAEELQLGLDSFIFIDDNPMECAEVRAGCPEVLTLQLPVSPEAIEPFLYHQWAFDRLEITEEDQKRTQRYKENAGREAYRKTALSFASFIEGLQLDVQISEPAPDQLTRLAQLTQRTNQFNFTTIRRNEAQIGTLLREGALRAAVVAVKDRFGDYGLVGAMLYYETDTALQLDTMLLSCRVLGKGVEYQMLQYLGKQALAAECPNVSIAFIPTRKNQPARDFLERVSNGASTHTLPEAYFQATRGKTDGPTGQGIEYILAVDKLNDLSFDPGKAVQESTENAGAKPAKTTEKPEIATDLQILERIALNYTTVDDILHAIDTKPRHKRSLDTRFVAPTDDLQRSIAEIWQDVLELDRVGIDDPFFDIGGTSLKAVQTISRLKQDLQVDIATVSLFDKTTVREIAALLSGKDEGKEKTAAVRNRGERRRARRTRRRRK